MLDLHNQTPFAAGIFPTIDRDGAESLNIAVKSSYVWKPGKSVLTVAEKQEPLVAADQLNGEDPALSSVRYESDYCPTKTGTDVLLRGHAWAAKGRTAEMNVGLRVGPLQKVIRVCGERKWYRAAFVWCISAPLPFERMPLVYERAYGGVDDASSDERQHGREERNPVGRGFCATGARERLEGLLLPNLEMPANVIRSWKDRPPIAGFGPVARSWLPRRTLAGTYDARWQSDRAPLLPQDFDARYFNAAPADQVISPHLKGGEPVKAVGVGPDGDLSFALPRPDFSLSLRIRGKPSTHALKLDTVLLEPDERRVVLTFKATVPCSRKLLFVDQIVVRGG